MSGVTKGVARLPFGELIRLSDGHQIPQLGFGVYEMSGRECLRCVKDALSAGYRSIDSAEWYGNEVETGRAMRDFMESSRGTVVRSDLYYTSKLQSNGTYEHAARAIRKSVEACGLGYIDLYLLHSPYPDKKSRLESWRACEDAQEAGLVRSIGVSNFGVRHLKELMQHEGSGGTRSRRMPVVNQIDVHPFMTRSAEVDFCREQGIAVEAWGPLVRGERMRDATLLEIARARGKTVAQCLLRWSIQRGFICIPKSVKVDRIRENCKIFDFELSEGEMRRMDGLDEYLVTDWDPIGDSRV